MTDEATSAGIASLGGPESGPRTYTPWGWALDTARLVWRTPRLLAIYGRSRVDAATRERVMVAVSRANACAACTRVHEGWALRAGVSPAELQQIGAGALSEMPTEQQAAILYATALAESQFGAVPDAVGAVVSAHLDPNRQRDIAAIARLMSFANLTANSLRVLTRRS